MLYSIGLSAADACGQTLPTCCHERSRKQLPRSALQAKRPPCCLHSDTERHQASCTLQGAGFRGLSRPRLACVASGLGSTGPSWTGAAQRQLTSNLPRSHRPAGDCPGVKPMCGVLFAQGHRSGSDSIRKEACRHGATERSKGCRLQGPAFASVCRSHFASTHTHTSLRHGDEHVVTAALRGLGRGVPS